MSDICSKHLLLTLFPLSPSSDFRKNYSPQFNSDSDQLCLNSKSEGTYPLLNEVVSQETDRNLLGIHACTMRKFSPLRTVELPQPLGEELRNIHFPFHSLGKTFREPFHIFSKVIVGSIILTVSKSITCPCIGFISFPLSLIPAL